MKFSAHVTRGRGSVLVGRQFNTLCTSGFVDDVMFSHRGASHRRMRTSVKLTPRCRVCRRSKLDTGEKSANYDCFVIYY